MNKSQKLEEVIRQLKYYRSELGLLKGDFNDEIYAIIEQSQDFVDDAIQTACEALKMQSQVL